MATSTTVAPLPPQSTCIGYELFKPDVSPVVESFTVPTNYRLFAASVAPTADDGTVGDWWQFFDAIIVKIYQKTSESVWTLVTTIGDVPDPTSETTYCQTTEKTVANTVTETTLITSGVGSVNAGFEIGTAVRISIAGFFSSDNTGTTQLTLSYTINGQAMVNIIPTVPQNVTNNGFESHMLLIARDDGASGFTGKPQGKLSMGSGQTGYDYYGVATVNRTVQDGAVNVTAQWSAASALNTITVTQIVIETLR